MPKAIKKKVVKPAKAEEGVKDVFFGTRDYISERQKIFLPVMIAVVVISIAVAGFFIYRSHAGSKARSLEYEGYKIYYGLYQKQPLQKEERYQKALEKFREAYSLRKSAYSLYYAASCLNEMGKYDEALKNLKELNERFSDDEVLVPLSHHKIAGISLRKGDREAALKSLDTLYNYRTAALRDLALIESARILEAMGKTAESSKKYEEIAKNFPASPFAGEAQAKLGPKKETPAKP
ncbi:MAG TPA: tetratricopeptide repeat protein [Thermodesulfovibrionales bacterium]|nr:tetratricopeptide repeat protein [Thermodesulfovibrionales bacterium]